MSRDVQLTPEQRQVYRRFAGLALPRHTSYPIAPIWTEGYGASEFRQELERLGKAQRPLSLYAHVPYCERLCYYCACSKEIFAGERRAVADPVPALLEGFRIEAERISALAGAAEVKAMHWGGGSPTFLEAKSLETLFNLFHSRFRFAPDAEIAIEIDPRITSLQQLETLKRLGFNRISLGVQDFDPNVQAAVNRIQPYEVVERVVNECRSLGFKSINFDLIYGLPFQDLKSLADTLEKTIRLAPDRIAFYRLAVIPEIFRWQNKFVAADLPSGEASLDLNLLAINQFQNAGYRFIGLDHFAKPEEGLSRAAEEGSLQRNFQGMTTHRELEIVGFGPSAISQTTRCFAQSHKTTEAWAKAVRGDFATHRGMWLSDDDRLRQALLQELYGLGTITKRALENEHAVVFDDYFKDELDRLTDLTQLGIIEVGPDQIRLTEPLGRLLVRVVASVFDKYLPREAYRNGLSPEQASRVG